MTGEDNLERTFKFTEDNGGNWTGLSLQKIIKNLSRIWLAMMNQEVKPFTPNVSMIICQTTNLKIVATQVISYQVRTSNVDNRLFLAVFPLRII